MLSIERTTLDNLKEIEEIFSIARKYMENEGNGSQWSDNRPDISLVINDIENNSSYVVKNDGKVVATFAFIEGIEPTYLEIDGEWLDDAPYGTIHRIASDGSTKGIFDFVIDYVSKRGIDIRIDTHRNNKTMLHLIEKNGFVRCGTIIVDDGTERIAFQKKI